MSWRPVPRTMSRIWCCAFWDIRVIGVPRTIARINNPRNAWLFDQKFADGLNQSEILATLIEEEMSLGDMMILLRLRRGRYSLVQEKVHEAASRSGWP